MRQLLASILLLFGLAAGARAAESKPNIVFILADDLGYGDVQCLGGDRSKIPTPNIDRLATQGMTFTDAHSGSSVCTPTRYGVLTGRYAWRTRLQKGVMQDNQPPLIAKDRLTVGKLLQQQGYYTACVGKWHLGYLYQDVTNSPKSAKRPKAWPPVGTRFLDGPLTRGFDYFYGFHHAGSMSTLAENDRVIAKIEPIEMLPRLTRCAVKYIGERAAAGQPFFLYLPWNSPHGPIVPSKEWQGKSGINPYSDYVMQTDAAVGEVLAALDQHHLTDNTLVIFTSDNGCSPIANFAKLKNHGHYPSYIFRGAKADIWDGGHRVPFFARWPGHVKPGSTSKQLVCLGDLMATCADLLGVKLPANAAEDSLSFLPALTGAGTSARDTVVHHSISGKFAIRQGKWKLEFCAGSGGWSSPKDAAAAKQGLPVVQLYDLATDIGEKNNVEAQHPEVVKKLTALLEQYVAEGRSTPGPKQKNDVPIDIYKKGKNE